MIEEVRVALVQMAAKQAVFNVEDRDENVRCIIEHMGRLGEENDLVVFPELSTSGYTPFGYSGKSRVRLWEAAEDPETSPIMREILKASEETDCVFVLGFAERSAIKYEVYDSAATISRGRLLGIQRKIHLGGEEVHYFIPGPEPKVLDTRLGKIGIAICYDMVFPEVSRVLAIKGAEIIVFINGFGDHGNLKLYRQFIPTARALENQVHVIFCNAVGMAGKAGEYQLPFSGGSKIVSALGEVVAESTTDREEIVTGKITRRGLEKAVSIFFIYRDRRIDAYGPLTRPYC